MSTHRITLIEDFGDTEPLSVYKPTHPSSRCDNKCSICDHTEICSGAPLRTDLHRVELANGQTMAVPTAREVAERRDVQRAHRVIRRERFLKLVFPWIATAALVLAVFTVTMSAAHAATAEQEAQAMAVADGVSTAIVVGTGVGVEANSLLSGSPIGIAMATATKVTLPYATRGMAPADRAFVLKVSTAVYGGAAAWNLCLLAGPAAPVCYAVGAGTGAYMWARASNKLDSEAITAPEPGVSLALLSPEVLP